MKRIIPLLAVLAALLPLAAMAQAVDNGGATTPLDSMSTFTLWAIVGGAITSGVTSVVKRHSWPADVNVAVFIALSCVTAAVDAYFKRELSLADWSRSLVLVLASGIATYYATRPAQAAITARTNPPATAAKP